MKRVCFEIPEGIPDIFREVCQAACRDASFLLKAIAPMNGWIMYSFSADHTALGLSLDFVFLSKKDKLFSDDSREVMLDFDQYEVSFWMDEETDRPIEKTWAYSAFENMEQMLQAISDLIAQNL